MARATHAPKTEVPMRGTAHKAPVFGVAALAIGLLTVAMGMSDHASHASITSWEQLRPGQVAHSEVDFAQRTGSLSRSAPRLTQLGAGRLDSPPRLAIMTDWPTIQLHVDMVDQRGRRDARWRLSQAAAQARRSQLWIERPPGCQMPRCSLASAMPGNWAPRP